MSSETTNSLLIFRGEHELLLNIVGGAYIYKLH